MIKIKIITNNGKEIPCLIKNRYYKRLIQGYGKLSLWEKIKILFKLKERESK